MYIMQKCLIFFLYENSFRVTTPMEFNLNFLIFREDRTIFSNNTRILFFVNFHLFVNTSFKFSPVSSKKKFGIAIFSTRDDAHSPAFTSFYRTCCVNLMTTMTIPSSKPKHYYFTNHHDDFDSTNRF